VSRAKALAVVIPAALALVVAVGVAVASSTSVTITSPKEGQSISQKRVPNLPVFGGVTFASATASSTAYYLRRDGCGTSSDNPHLSITSGTDAGNGCGLTVTVVGVGGDADANAYVDYPSSDGMPLSLDASRKVTGTIDLDSFSVQGTGIAAGAVTVDVSLEALVNGNGVSVGSDSETVVATPGAADYPVNFQITPNSQLDRADISALDLRIHLHGPYAFSGFIANSGKSLITVPSNTASVNRAVQLSLDDPTFGETVPVAINSSDNGWSVVISTPAVGKHTLYVRSTQGFDTSNTVVRHFTVTK
jgi:hypothetical protein